MSVCIANKKTWDQNLYTYHSFVFQHGFSESLIVSKNIASLTFVTFQCLTNFCPITKFVRHVLELPLPLYLLLITEKLKRKAYFLSICVFFFII